MAPVRTVHVFSVIPNLIKELNKSCPTIKFKDVPFPASPEFNDEVLTKLQEADIIVSDPGIHPYIKQLSNLKWLQLTWAGVNTIIPYFACSPPSFLFTRFGGVFGQQMAEYVLGNIIATERSSRLFWNKQDKHIWLDYLQFRKLSNLTLGILGFGNIGEDVAKCCKALGMTIWAMGRTPRTVLPANVDQYRTVSDLDEVLKSSDYICNILPSTPQTKNLLSGDVLQVCQTRQSVFINVGRGDVIDEKSLVNALKKGWISEAILDVFEKEPLPMESELWDMPQVKITPHCSALSFPTDVADVFAENVKLYEEGKEMDFVVDVTRGY